jgi:hypothetical protein
MCKRGNRVDNKLSVRGLGFAPLRGHGVSSYTDERRSQLDRRSIGVAATEFPDSRRYLDTRTIKSRFLCDFANPASHASGYPTTFPVIIARDVSRSSRIHEEIMAGSSARFCTFNGLGVVCGLLYALPWFQNNRPETECKAQED